MLDDWLDLVHGGGCVGCGSPGRALCRDCAAELPTAGRAVRPTPCPDGLVRCFAAGEYDGLLRAMVLAHKEHAAYSLAGPLGRVLAAVTVPILGAGTTVLVPVPSRPGVVRSRGHDPMRRVAGATARQLRQAGGRVRVCRLLEVRAMVRDQAGLGARDRAANLAGSLGVRAPARAALARAGGAFSVIVCDDVLTTGATAREAQRALEDCGLAVRAVVTVAATRKRVAPPGGAVRGFCQALPLLGHAD